MSESEPFDPQRTTLERDPATKGGPTPAFRRGWPSLPGYQVVDELGRGGMGVVYKAWQPSLKRYVALKMIRGAGAAPDEIERFRREASLAAQLHHPHIVQVFEVGEHFETGVQTPNIP